MPLRISQMDWPRILFTRSVAILLGIAAVFSIGCLVIIHSNIRPDALSPLNRGLLSITGFACAIGFILLLVFMGFFWMKCDVSSKRNRTIWFIALVLGFSFGSQIAYYAIVYLPAVRRRLRNPEDEEFVLDCAQEKPNTNRLGPFSRALFVVWGGVFLAVAGTLIFPKSPPYLDEIVAVCFLLSSAIVVFEAVFHVIVSVFRSGLSRPVRPSRTDSSRSRGRD
jgi:hypothetical protein